MFFELITSIVNFNKYAQHSIKTNIASRNQLCLIEINIKKLKISSFKKIVKQITFRKNPINRIMERKI